MLGKQTIEQQLPYITQNDTTNQVRHKKDRSENIGPFDFFSQTHCHGERQHIDQYHSNNGKQRGK